MTAQTIAAHTPPGAFYPGYFNATRQDDGSVKITIRSEAVEKPGRQVCGADCKPGLPSCNGYCHGANKAPRDMIAIREGALAAFTIDPAAWEKIVQDAACELIERGLTFSARAGQPVEA